MVYRFDDCELDAGRFELRRAGRPTSLEPQVFELLVYLIANRDRVVTRRELYERVWRGRIVSDAALNSRIKAVRSAIGDDGKAQSRIRTLHRTGYRFVGDVTETTAAAPPNDASRRATSPSLAEAPPIRPRRGRRPLPARRAG